MRWYTKQRVYGDLVVVHDNSYSRITQEASALLKQAGSIMSLATAGRAAKATGVGDFLSSKVEAACDTGGNVRKVFQAVVGVYFSEVQKEVMDEVARRLKTLSYSHNKKKGRRQRRDLQSTLRRCNWRVGGSTCRSGGSRNSSWISARGCCTTNCRTTRRSGGSSGAAGWWVAPAHQALLRWGIQAFLYSWGNGDARSDGRVAALRVHLQLQGIQFLSGVLAMFQGR